MGKKTLQFLKKYYFILLASLFYILLQVRLTWPSQHSLYKFTTFLDALVFITSIIIMVSQLPLKSNKPHNYIISRAICAAIIIAPTACLLAKYLYKIDNYYISEFVNIIAAYTGIMGSFLSLYNNQTKGKNPS